VQWLGDIDILAISDGKFIIGEAKFNVSEFTTDVIKSMTALVEKVRPDVLIIAYCEGDLSNDKRKKIESALREFNCEIIVHKVPDPWYHHGQLFGLPK
jgi:hypothetical protein